ncbi:hypothetical protein NEMIN01_1568 [Nematocida minor]|uniref:uncharacterized protein n=1 Tax=Nematocida minor TaxID=1912983 RepID=UPI00221FF07E|nr:uncharacterized protein NEMIN01_1568 [Nematocida minor]KAI5191542.1 hypothetical protein NEMIN01_1568 [Nematocida minor]
MKIRKTVVTAAILNGVLAMESVPDWQYCNILSDINTLQNTMCKLYRTKLGLRQPWLIGQNIPPAAPSVIRQPYTYPMNKEGPEVPTKEDIQRSILGVLSSTRGGLCGDKTLLICLPGETNGGISSDVPQTKNLPNLVINIGSTDKNGNTVNDMISRIIIKKDNKTSAVIESDCKNSSSTSANIQACTHPLDVVRGTQSTNMHGQIIGSQGTLQGAGGVLLNNTTDHQIFAAGVETHSGNNGQNREIYAAGVEAQNHSNLNGMNNGRMGNVNNQMNNGSFNNNSNYNNNNSGYNNGQINHSGYNNSNNSGYNNNNNSNYNNNNGQINQPGYNNSQMGNQTGSGLLNNNGTHIHGVVDEKVQGNGTVTGAGFVEYDTRGNVPGYNKKTGMPVENNQGKYEAPLRKNNGIKYCDDPEVVNCIPRGNSTKSDAYPEYEPERKPWSKKNSPKDSKERMRRKRKEREQKDLIKEEIKKEFKEQEKALKKELKSLQKRKNEEENIFKKLQKIDNENNDEVERPKRQDKFTWVKEGEGRYRRVSLDPYDSPLDEPASPKYSSIPQNEPLHSDASNKEALLRIERALRDLERKTSQKPNIPEYMPSIPKTHYIDADPEPVVYRRAHPPVGYLERSPHYLIKSELPKKDKDLVYIRETSLL